MGVCYGNGEDHCCYINSRPCEFLERDTVPGRRWACGLRREYGNWDDVLASDRYQQRVAVVFDRLGINCRDWPGPEVYCGACGRGPSGNASV